MPIHDPVADYLTRIRNALQVKHSQVSIRGSRLTLEMTQILVNEGFIEGSEFVEDSKQGEIRIKLKYDAKGNAAISGLRRISRPGLRKYVGKSEIPRVLGGLGIAILSTPKGVLVDKDARRAGVGGEVLCYVW
ncbi:30S ribosomal protein S8 [candidate division TA06 bacterium DG_26]|uniref:Small ribosomal subunit protein uS8 n=1 Tax=candidate division TA06 bacterium DG_26 TaxID=1703771 RepID=A0A0S7WJR7_UNCT6|nr:MAG: 30S ribosomal protein S8 [candidate division TA06 bacterium DG_26]